MSHKPEVITQIITLEDGREIKIETGKLAKLADGCVTLTMGNTVLLATVVANRTAKEGVDFMPLTVDYQEKYASTGRFPGGFLKRESRLSDYEVLISRLIDRALRPLFPDDYHCDTQVMVSLISSDKQESPDALAGLAASAALTISPIPFLGPISEVRVALIDGVYKVNPNIDQLPLATLDIIVSGSLTDINMVEGEMKEVSEEMMLEAIKIAHEEIKKHCQAQLELREKCGQPKFEYDPEPENEEIKTKVAELFSDKLLEISLKASSKSERTDAYSALLSDYLEAQPEEEITDEVKGFYKKYYSKLKKEVVRNMVLDHKTRLDGRKTDEIRPIWSETNILPMAHGSAVFTRGETQALATVTLGTKMDEQLIDGAIYQGTSRLLLHYNFPGFSTGEVRPNRGAGRREIGHGNLALRALRAILPSVEDNPYVIRIVSDVLESNGSSSMATVCAGTLALMDAGVKLKKPVSGIAMGLISRPSDKAYAVLSDILGDEDHLGDMDFKVTGTEDGITACQMDLKVDGLSYEVLAEALHQAKRGRLHILEKINEELSVPREDYKSFVPRIHRFEVHKDFIGAIIGTGGKVIQAIQRETGTVITIEEVGNVGVVEISSPDKVAMEKAFEWISGIISIPEVGTVYEAKVKSLQPFGAIMEFLPGKEGLLHVSEIKYERVEDVADLYQEGDIIQVKLIEIDQRTGKYRLSAKALLEKPEGYVERERAPRRDDRGGRDDRRGGGRDDRRDDRGPRRDDRGPRRDDRPRDDRPREDRPAREDRPRDENAPRRDSRYDGGGNNQNQNTQNQAPNNEGDGFLGRGDN